MNRDNWHIWTTYYGKGRHRWRYAARHWVGQGPRENTEGHISWSLLGGYHWNKTLGFQFGRNGSESDIGLDLHIPWLGSLYARLRCPWTRRFQITQESGDPDWLYARHYSLKLNYAGHWIAGTWDEREGLWDRDQPWYRSWHISPRHLWGRRHSERVVEETGDTTVPMPEGAYPATWERSHYVRRYVRWPGTWRDRLLGSDQPGESRYSLDVEGGIPEWGKGENSWDCGMNGSYGISGPFRTLEQAVGGMVESVLRDRRKYGGPHDLPHPMTVREAEAHVTASRQ